MLIFDIEAERCPDMPLSITDLLKRVGVAASVLHSFL
jgi:hypothetical protein